eukprot:s4951_g5.t1
MVKILLLIATNRHPRDKWSPALRRRGRQLEPWAISWVVEWPGTNPGCMHGFNEVMMIDAEWKLNVAIITLKAVGANGAVPGTDELDAAAKRLILRRISRDCKHACMHE